MAFVYNKAEGATSKENTYIKGQYPIKSGIIVQDFYVFENISDYDYADKNEGIPSQIQTYLQAQGCKNIDVKLVSESDTELKYNATFYC